MIEGVSDSWLRLLPGLDALADWQRSLGKGGGEVGGCGWRAWILQLASSAVAWFGALSPKVGLPDYPTKYNGGG